MIVLNKMVLVLGRRIRARAPSSTEHEDEHDNPTNLFAFETYAIRDRFPLVITSVPSPTSNAGENWAQVAYLDCTLVGIVA